MPVYIVVDGSESDTESDEQDGTCIRTSEELPEQEWKPAKGFSTKGFSAKFMVVKYFNSRASIPGGKPCISGEQLARPCPNWYHGRVAEIASMAVQGLDAMAVHTAYR
jgi:hypothetical protein